MDFHYSVTTGKTIDEAISALEQNWKKNKFGILWHLDRPEESLPVFSKIVNKQ